LTLQEEIKQTIKDSFLIPTFESKKALEYWRNISKESNKYAASSSFHQKLGEFEEFIRA
jgi:hypothetical protein